MTPERFIETLALSQENVAPPRRPRGGLESLGAGADAAVPAGTPAMPLPRGSLQAAVDVGSVVSFVQGVSAEQKDDVLLGVQLAQRGASGKYNRFTQAESWYQLYAEILSNLGWVGEQLAFVKHDKQQGELRMDQAALAIITAIATQNQLLVLQEAIKALSALAEEDGTIRLFDFHSAAQAGGNFQMGAVQKTGNGALSMALGAFHYSSNDTRRRFLFFSWGAQQVNFWTAAQKMTLNEGFYAERREAVRKKLGVAADGFIAGLVVG